jgi:spermidine synthase
MGRDWIAGPLTAERGSARLAALHGLFFVSGGLGLAYEVLWMRRFAPLFGSTALAATATLSSFFLGNAAGSVTLGARSRMWSRPLVAFGLLEIGVGIGALLVGPMLHLYALSYPGLYDHLSRFPESFALAKLGLACLAVGVPAFFMGGTLPVLGEAVAPFGRRLGVSLGSLYAVNVLGAALGAMAVPFVLLPHIGLRRAELLVVAGSLSVGLAAVAVGSGMAKPQTPPSEGANRRRGRPATGSPRLAPGSVLALAGWSGLATLGLEILWTRMFSLVHESSVYSFAVVVVVFLVGLSAGAALARLALARGLLPRRLLGWSWSVAGLLVVVSPRLFYHLTNGLQYLPSEDWPASAAGLSSLVCVTLLPASTALGMALPLLMEMSSREGRSSGLLLGRLMGVNTAAAILGPLLVTFLVAPMLGLWRSLVLLGGLTLLLGSLVGLAGASRWSAWIAMVVALLTLRPASIPPVRVREGERLVSVREGSYGTAAVLEDGRDRWITVNNSYILGGAAAAVEERWQGHLPMLLHPAPRNVAFLGTGTGIAVGAVLSHSVARVVALEIVPEVAAAARDDFGDLNGGVMTDPRTTVVVDDGRNYLLAAPAGRFDVIVGDLLVPWRSGESALYTREHFATVRRALAPDGLFCQWLPLYQLSEPQLAILLRTFLDVFPRTTVWRGNFLPAEPTLALIGHRSPGSLDVAGIDRREAGLASSIGSGDPMLADPAGLWLSLVGAPGGDAPWLATAPQNTDDEPWVELLSPRGGRRVVDGSMATVLDRIAASPLEGSPLASLDAAHRAWRDTGMALGRASLDRGPTGEAQVLALLRTLPAPLRAALGVPAP